MHSDDSKQDRYDKNALRRKRDIHNKDQYKGDNGYNKDNGYNGDEEFYGDMMNGMPKSGFDQVGDLICFVKPDFISYESEEACKAMMKAMRGCIHKYVPQLLFV